LRDRLAAAAGFRCGYCRSSEKVTGIKLVLDHIVPRARGGTDAEVNRWPICDPCNEFKQARIRARDPERGEFAPLFDPRQQHWRDHFAWVDGGLHIVGLTPTGRATVAALRLNRELLVEARAAWIGFGVHPPAQDG
jgi:hypothetical protein